jgi:outer membrane receptor protein involved in Fe transport
VLTGGITPDGRDVVQSRNVASADIRGIESALRWELSARATAELVANYVYGVQQEADGSRDPADRIPPFNGRLSLALQAGNAWVIEPFLRFAAAQDRLSQRDIRDVRINPNGTPGWVTVNIAGNWSRGDRWRASAGIDNLLDKQYRQHGSGIDANGINFYLNLHYAW